MDPGPNLPDGLPDEREDRELVAPRVDAELEVSRQAVRPDGVSDDSDVGGELSGEAGHVADVVDPFVEAAAEPGGDGPHRDAFIGQGREDHEQL